MASNLYKYFLSLFFLFYQTVLLSETLDEIIVSGDWREIEQTRKESSLEVFNENFLEKRKIKHFEDLTYSIPNLNFAASDSRPRYFQIRGIGERSGYEGTPNSSVGFLIDDIDFSGQGGIASSYDIDPVHVLFTSGATEANNSIFCVLARRAEMSSRVLLSPFEHPSVTEAAHYWFPDCVDYLNAKPDGTVSVDEIN